MQEKHICTYKSYSKKQYSFSKNILNGWTQNKKKTFIKIETKIQDLQMYVKWNKSTSPTTVCKVTYKNYIQLLQICRCETLSWNVYSKRGKLNDAKKQKTKNPKVKKKIYTNQTLRTCTKCEINGGWTKKRVIAKCKNKTQCGELQFMQI